MTRVTLIAIVLILGVASIVAGCSGSSTPDAEVDAEQAVAQQSEPAQQESTVQDEPADDAEQAVEQQSEAAQQESTVQDEPADDDVEFDISNWKHAAARLTILHGVLLDGNPIDDPIGWAKAGAAALRIDELCNNFEIDEALDPACDQLLLAGETPFNQVTPVLVAAAAELREVITRRELAEVRGASDWDADIVDFRLSQDMRTELSGLKTAMERCAEFEFHCDTTPMEEALARMALQRLLLSSSGDDFEIADLITYAATDDLWNRVSEFSDEVSTYGRSLDARYIVEELEDLGIY